MEYFCCKFVCLFVQFILHGLRPLYRPASPWYPVFVKSVCECNVLYMIALEYLDFNVSSDSTIAESTIFIVNNI